jgi:hypothetical protein
MTTTKHNTKEEIIATYNKLMMDFFMKQLPSIENITIQTWFRYQLYCLSKLVVVQKIVVTALKQQVPHLS